MTNNTIKQKREEAEQITAKLKEILDLWESKKNSFDWFDKWQQISDFYENTFIELKNLIEDDNHWLEAIQSNASDLLNRLDEIEKQVLEKQENFNNSENQLKSLEENNLKLKADLESMLWIAIDKSLSASFDHRYEQLNWEKWFWKWLSIIWFWFFSIFTWYTLITFEWDLTKFLIEKIWILIPIALISYIFYYEYKRIDKKAENYAFKRTIASTLNSYVEILESKIINDETNSSFKTKILDFMLSSMKDIYNEPIDEKNAELEFKTKFLNQEISLKNTEDNKKQWTPEKELK